MSVSWGSFNSGAEQRGGTREKRGLKVYGRWEAEFSSWQEAEKIGKHVAIFCNISQLKSAKRREPGLKFTIRGKIRTLICLPHLKG